MVLKNLTKNFSFILIPLKLNSLRKYMENFWNLYKGNECVKKKQKKKKEKKEKN